MDWELREDMIDRYLARGRMYVLDDPGRAPELSHGRRPDFVSKPYDMTVRQMA